MFQRLLFTLSVCLCSVALFSQDVMRPTDPCYRYDPNAAAGSFTNPSIPLPNQFSKWVHDPTQNGAGRPVSDTIGAHGFDQSTYKCYIYGNVPYRLRFPNGYDQNSSTKYPLIVFLHGAGESAKKSYLNNQYKVGTVTNYIDRENQDQLYWGAQDFENRMNNGEWNGFLLFPQLWSDGAAWDAGSTIPPVNGILDALEQYNHLDPSRVIVMGLSAGGIGTLNYCAAFPQRIATSITSCPPQLPAVTLFANRTDAMLQIPIFFGSGGQDGGSGGTFPTQAFDFRDSMAAKGGNLYETYITSAGHVMWTYQWAMKNQSNKYILSEFWNSAHKAQPLVYYQKTEFCTTEAISAKMGITAGFLAYEWQYDGGSGFGTIAGATSNTYIATQVGRYRVRYQRDASTAWSDWTPQPIVITTKKCSLDTVFYTGFEETPNAYYAVFPGSGGTQSPFTYQNTPCQNGLFINNSDNITRGPDKEGSRFLLHYGYTSDFSNSCALSYRVGDQLWRSSPSFNINVQYNTDYLVSFYMANNNTSGNFASIYPTVNDQTLPGGSASSTLSGDISWKKYSYVWNSGGWNSAIVALLSNYTGSSSSGREFAIDNISMIKYKPLYPGGSLQRYNLWVRASDISGIPNGSGFAIWNNQSINGNNLVQPYYQKDPFYKNNPADNINFNPTGGFTVANQSYLGVQNGFSGTATHTAAYVYVVLRNRNINQVATIVRENQSSGTKRAVMVQFDGNKMNWTGGEDSTNVLKTAAGVVDTLPAVWTFSRNNTTGRTTPSGFARDIRKNGTVVASSATATTTSFTGNNLDFTITSAQGGTFNTNNWGTFDGNVAEVIYVLDSNLTVKKQNGIESYLALKYGTTLGTNASPVNYTASDSTTVYWTASNVYQNDVFGIGTDSLTGLVQKQSNSVNAGNGNGVGYQAKGNLVLSTPTDLGDKQFLVIGNDAGSLAQSVIASGQAPIIAVGSTRIGREWKVQNTGSVGAVNLSFDTTGLMSQAGGADYHNYALMVDADGDGDFNTGTVTFLNATGGSGQLILFNGVTLPNNAVFSVITAKSSSLLPATWLSFTAEEVNGNALLTWKTADEMNVDKYVVEHSYDGISFAAVGSAAAKNSSGTNTYTFLHTNLTPGVHYYRIRRVDLNGKTELSVQRSVKIATQGANLVIRPNPVSGNMLMLSVNVAQNTRTAVQVLSMDGKMMSKSTVNLTAGSNLVNVDISFVPAGVYLLEVQLNDALIVKKFIRQ